MSAVPSSTNLSGGAMHSLASIGSAKLLVRGLNPQRITSRSEARVPGIPNWRGMDYQATGMGEASVRLEALTYPHVIGGLDSLALLQKHHEGEEVVNYIRLGPYYQGKNLGQVRIRHIVVDETNLHPFDGVGRRVGVELDLVFVGGP